MLTWTKPRILKSYIAYSLKKNYSPTKTPLIKRAREDMMHEATSHLQSWHELMVESVMNDKIRAIGVDAESSWAAAGGRLGGSGEGYQRVPAIGEPLLGRAGGVIGAGTSGEGLGAAPRDDDEGRSSRGGAFLTILLLTGA